MNDGHIALGTVLLVDDDESARSALTEILASLGYFVLCADNGAVALQSLHIVLPDAVVTDLDMPLLDGMGLCRAIRADRSLRHLPVIVASSLQLGEFEPRDLFDLYLRKPISPGTLISSVSTLVRDRFAENGQQTPLLHCLEEETK